MYFEDIVENGGGAIKLIFLISKIDKLRQRNIVGRNGFIIKK